MEKYFQDLFTSINLYSGGEAAPEVAEAVNQLYRVAPWGG